MSGTMISDSKSNLGCITFPPSFLLPPPFLGLTSSLPERVFESINVVIDFRAGLLRKKKKKNKEGKENTCCSAQDGRNHFRRRTRIFFFPFFLTSISSVNLVGTIIRWNRISRRISPGRFANLIDRRGERRCVGTIIELIEER